MVLSNIKKRAQERGFTIVELLIVIVVIGILAGITIVAYSGITAKANATKAQTNAVAVQKVAEAFNADKGYYPALATTGTDALTLGSTSTKVPTGIVVIPDAGTPAITASNGLTTVAYSCLTSCTASTGGRIAWWDFSKASSQLTYIYVGSAASGGTFVYPAT
jgi:prepilin-type N-terminal cleavage/methylation domain-containing protein